MQICVVVYRATCRVRLCGVDEQGRRLARWSNSRSAQLNWPGMSRLESELVDMIIVATALALSRAGICRNIQ